MNAHWLLSWWNLIFLLPFGLAAIYLGLYALTGITFGDADADHDFDADADHDIGHDVGHDVEHDFDADADADADVDADADADADTDADAPAHGTAHDHVVADGQGSSLPMAVLTWFGVGRVPLSILFMVLFFAWGAIGFMINNALKEKMGETWQVAAYSLPAAAFGSLLLTRVVSRLITRFLPLNETYAGRRHDLLGAVGEAIFEIDEKFGMASVRDERGNLYHVPCKLAGGAVGGEGAAAVIAKGARAKLVGYNGKLKLYLVIPDPSSSPTPSPGAGGAKAVA
jgi:hypothetical protein